MKLCNQVCRWNDYADGCTKPFEAICPLSNIARDTNVLTNADHIRSMTDEELSKRGVRHAVTFVDNGRSGYYGSAWETSDGTIFWTEKPAVEYELNWLKQPYKEET